ncbi:MAG: hypothetical protein JXB39_09670 [Deltaproteobacteria bacterium]|nr:hypothetical protein [Deltaproteobacteria bacterium]
MALLSLLPLVVAASAQDGGSFGTDLSAGIGAGSLLGEWPRPGIHTAWQVRFEAFPDSRDIPGPRVGASLFAEGSAIVRQEAREVGEEAVRVFPFSYVHWGMLVAIRPDPQATWGGLASVGFGRLDLDDFWSASYAVPMATFEAGARRRVGHPSNPGFLDLAIRASWGSARGPGTEPGSALDDWWLVGAALRVGAHVR